MITVRRQFPDRTEHVVRIRDHEVITDMDPGAGGTDAGPDPHDLYDSALGACKALTVLWYAQRNAIPVTDIEVVVVRDSSEERQGRYRLKTVLSLGGELSGEQRQALLRAAEKCPIHRLMTTVTTEIETTLADDAE